MQKSLSCLRKTLLVQKGREETTIASISSPMDPSNKDVISWASQTVRLEMEGTALKRDMVDGKPKHRSQSEGLLGTLCRKLSFKQRSRGKDVVLSSFNSSKDDSPTDPSSSNILDAQLKKSANRAKGNHYDIIPLPSVDTISRLGCNDMESRESSGDQLLPCAVVARAQDCCDMPFPDLDPHSCAMELSLDWNLNPDMSLPQVTSSTDGDINCNGYFQYDLDVVHALIPGYSHVLECTDGSHEDTDIAELLQDDVSRSIPHNFEDQHLLIRSELDYAGALNGNLEIPKDSTRSRPIFIPPDGPPSSPLVPPAARGQPRDVGSCSLLPVLDLNGCAMHDVPSGIAAPVRVARVALSLTEELKRLAKRGWYWGPITRWEAEEKLQGLPDGSFLVRDSSDERYLLSLSFRSQGRTLHTRIEHSNGRFSFYEQPDSEGQRSVVQLIELSVRDSEAGAFCYSRSRLPGAATYPVRLTAPVSRFMHVRSLQYLCRFIIRQNTRIDLIQQLPLPTKMKDYLQEKHY